MALPVLPLLALAALGAFAFGKKGSASSAPSSTVRVVTPSDPNTTAKIAQLAVAKARGQVAQKPAAPSGPVAVPSLQPASNVTRLPTNKPMSPSDFVNALNATPSTSSTPASAPSSATGFSASRARAGAPVIAANIASLKGKYNRNALAQWQSSAGLTPDGLYGPLSVSALKYYGIASPPKALFKGSQKTYAPPTN